MLQGRATEGAASVKQSCTHLLTSTALFPGWQHDPRSTVQVVNFHKRVLDKVTTILTSLEHQMAITKEAYYAEARCAPTLLTC